MVIVYFLSLVIGLPSASIQFADSLYKQGDFYNSATEYERYLFYNPNDTLSLIIKQKLARSYLKSNEIERGEKILNGLNIPKSEIDLARLYISQNELFKAKIELNDLLLFNNNISDSIKKEINYLLGTIALLEKEPKQAIDYFTQAQDNFLVAEAKQLTDLPKKNILMSQIMSSIIPGTGEMYSGKYGWGFLSLLVNTASIYGIIYAYKHKYYVDAALIFSMLFTRFYNGSRNNAKVYAQSYNERIYQEKLKHIKFR
jgi:predicted negative regulator of RcsB-dependent stress response